MSKVFPYFCPVPFNPLGTWRSFNEIYGTNYDTYSHPIAFKGIGYDLYAKEKEKEKEKKMMKKKSCDKNKCNN
jgi:hypothetical protein